MDNGCALALLTQNAEYAPYRRGLSEGLRCHIHHNQEKIGKPPLVRLHCLLACRVIRMARHDCIMAASDNFMRPRCRLIGLYKSGWDASASCSLQSCCATEASVEISVVYIPAARADKATVKGSPRQTSLSKSISIPRAALCTSPLQHLTLTLCSCNCANLGLPAARRGEGGEVLQYIQAA